LYEYFSISVVVSILELLQMYFSPVGTAKNTHKTFALISSLLKYTYINNVLPRQKLAYLFVQFI